MRKSSVRANSDVNLLGAGTVEGAIGTKAGKKEQPAVTAPDADKQARRADTADKRRASASRRASAARTKVVGKATSHNKKRSAKTKSSYTVMVPPALSLAVPLVAHGSERFQEQLHATEVSSRDPMVHLLLHTLSFFVMGVVFGGYVLVKPGIEKYERGGDVEPIVQLFFGLPICVLCFVTAVMGVLDWGRWGCNTRGNSLILWSWIINARFADFVQGHSKARYYSISVWLCIVTILMWQLISGDMGAIDIVEKHNVTDPLLNEVVAVECSGLSSAKACVNMSADTSFVTKVVPVPAPFTCRVTVKIRESTKTVLDQDDLDWFSYLFHGLDWIPEMLGLISHVQRDVRLSTNTNYSFTGNLLIPEMPKVVEVAMVNDAYFTRRNSSELNEEEVTNGTVHRWAALGETDAAGVATFTNTSVLYKLIIDEGVNTEFYRFVFRTASSNSHSSPRFQVLNEVLSTQQSLGSDFATWTSAQRRTYKVAEYSVDKVWTRTMHINVSQLIPQFDVSVMTRHLANRGRFECNRIWDKKNFYRNAACLSLCETCRTRTASCKQAVFTCDSGVPKCHDNCTLPESGDDRTCLQLPLNHMGAPHYDVSRTITLRTWRRNDTTQKWHRADLLFPILSSTNGMVMHKGIPVESSAPSFFSDENGTASVSVRFSSVAPTGAYKLQAFSQGVPSAFADAAIIEVTNPDQIVPIVCEDKSAGTNLNDFVQSSGTVFLKGAAWLLFAIAIPVIYGSREEINCKALWFGDELHEIKPAKALLLIIYATIAMLLLFSYFLINYTLARWNQANDCTGYTVYQMFISGMMIASIGTTWLSTIWAFVVSTKTPQSGEIPASWCGVNVERGYASVFEEKRHFYLVKLMLSDMKLIEMTNVNMKKPPPSFFARWLTTMKKVLAYTFCHKRWKRASKTKRHPSDDHDVTEEKEARSFRKKTADLTIFSSRFLLTFYATILLIGGFHAYMLCSIDWSSNQLDLWFYDFHGMLSTVQTNITTFVELGAALDLKSRINEQSYGGSSKPPINPSFQRVCRGACSTISRLSTAQMLASCIDSNGFNQAYGCVSSASWFFDMHGILNYTALSTGRVLPNAPDVDVNIKTAVDDEERGARNSDSFDLASKKLPGFDEVANVRKFQAEFQKMVNSNFDEKNKDQLRADSRQCLVGGAWLALLWVLNAWLGSGGMFEVYRDNILKMRRGEKMRPFDKVNFSLASQFVGFQIMHFVLAYGILFAVLSAVLFLASSKLTSEWFLNLVFTQVVVSLSLSLIVKMITQVLNNTFLQGKSPRFKIPFITRRLAFEKTDILLMMFGIVTGLGMASYRVYLLIQLTFSGFIRLDRCLLEGTKESKDFGYSSYVALITMDHIFCNPVKNMFLKCTELVSKRGTLVTAATEGLIASMSPRLKLPRDLINKLWDDLIKKKLWDDLKRKKVNILNPDDREKKLIDEIMQVYKKEDHFNEDDELIPHQDSDLFILNDASSVLGNEDVCAQRRFRKVVVRTVFNHAMRFQPHTKTKGENHWGTVWKLVDRAMATLTQADACANVKTRGHTDWVRLYDEVIEENETPQALTTRQEEDPLEDSDFCECESYKGTKPYDCEGCDCPYEKHKEFEGGEVRRLTRSRNWAPLTYYQQSLRWWMFVYLDKMPVLRESRRFLKLSEMIVHHSKCFIVKRHTWVKASVWVENDMLYFQESSNIALGSHMAEILNLTKVPKAPGNPLFGLVDGDGLSNADGDAYSRDVILIPETRLNDHGERVPDNCSVKWNGIKAPVIWTVPPLTKEGDFLDFEVDGVVSKVEMAKSAIKDLNAPKLGGKVTVEANSDGDEKGSSKPISGVFLNPVDWHSLPAPMMQELSDQDKAVKKATAFRRMLACCSKPDIIDTDDARLDPNKRSLRKQSSTMLTEAPGQYVLSLKKSVKGGDFFMCFDTAAERREMSDSIHTAWGRLRTGPGSHFMAPDLHHAGLFIGGEHGHMLRYQHWELIHAEEVCIGRKKEPCKRTSEEVDIDTWYYKHVQKNTKTQQWTESWWPMEDLTARKAYETFVAPTEDLTAKTAYEKNVVAASGMIKDVRYTITDYYEHHETDIVTVKLEPCVRSWLASGNTNYSNMEQFSTIFMFHDKPTLDNRTTSKFGVGGHHAMNS